MLQAGAGIRSVILEDSDLRDARIKAELVMTDLINAKDVSHLRIGHHRHGQGVIGRLHDNVVLSESAHRAARTMDGALGQDVGRECRKLVGHHAAFHPSPSGRRRISGGVWLSWPGQNGHFSENETAGLDSRCTAI